MIEEIVNTCWGLISKIAPIDKIADFVSKLFNFEQVTDVDSAVGVVTKTIEDLGDLQQVIRGDVSLTDFVIEQSKSETPIINMEDVLSKGVGLDKLKEKVDSFRQLSGLLEAVSG